MPKAPISRIRKKALSSAEEKKRKFRLSHPFYSRRSMERNHAIIGRIMEEKAFANIEEANAYLEKHVIGRRLPDYPPRTPLEAAQDLMFKAWEEPSRKKRIELARRALEISEDCADAFVLLAENAETLEETADLFEKGVRAGERALGPAGFQEHKGHFWGVLETRPYMRARAGLADCLWNLGRREESIAHYQELLRLNPGDNQGLRYILVNNLLAENHDRAARDLIDAYPGDCAAVWAYSKALLKFRREGSNEKMDKRLVKALDSNPFVPLFILGMWKLPKRIPETIGMGDESEAVDYVAGSLKIWYETPGALKWLARVTSAHVGLMNNKPTASGNSLQTIASVYRISSGNHRGR